MKCFFFCRVCVALVFSAAELLLYRKDALLKNKFFFILVCSFMEKRDFQTDYSIFHVNKFFDISLF